MLLTTRRQVIAQLRKFTNQGFDQGRLLFHNDDSCQTISDIKQFSLKDCWRSNGQMRSHVSKLFTDGDKITVEGVEAYNPAIHPGG